MHFARRQEGPKTPLPCFRGIRGLDIVRSLLEIEATFEKNLQILKDVRKTILDVKVKLFSVRNNSLLLQYFTRVQSRRYFIRFCCWLLGLISIVLGNNMAWWLQQVRTMSVYRMLFYIILDRHIKTMWMQFRINFVLCCFLLAVLRTFTCCVIYLRFRTGVKDLEVMVQNVIASAFDSLSRVEEGVEILDVFHHFSAREVRRNYSSEL